MLTIDEFLSGLDRRLRALFVDTNRQIELADFGHMAMEFNTYAKDHQHELVVPQREGEPSRVE